MTVELDADDRALLVHFLNRAVRSYTETEIVPVTAVGSDIFTWRCGECGTTGPSRRGLTHGPTCFFRRVENLRVKLLTTPPDPSDHPDSRIS